MLLLVPYFPSLSFILLMAVSASTAKVFIQSLCLKCRLCLKPLSKSFISESVNMMLVRFSVRL